MPLLARGSQLALMSSSVVMLPFPRAEAYGASKAGISYLAQSLRLDLAHKGIDVSEIRPGFVKTPLTDKNDFAMPMRISADKAANTIIQALAARRRLIAFPGRFIWLLTLLSWLPRSWLAAALGKPSAKTGAQYDSFNRQQAAHRHSRFGDLLAHLWLSVVAAV